MITKKIDFTGVISVNDANPNGDPLYENRPRQRLNGYGEITDVCIKRKLRNAASLVLNLPILLQADGLEQDDMTNVKDRIEATDGFIKWSGANGKKTGTKKELQALLNEMYFDVRAFGQVVSIKNLNTSVRGPVTIRMAKSVAPILIKENQITKSLSNESKKKKDDITEEKGSDTMGLKPMVEHGLYVFHGSISPQLASLTGFSNEDAEHLKEMILQMFEVDASAARPAGSMTLESLVWWEQEGKTGAVPPKKLHDAVVIRPTVESPESLEDYTFHLQSIDGLTPEVHGEITFEIL